jgi:hypothetical protein
MKFVEYRFCGCGMTIDAAEKLGRQWIGIDITQSAGVQEEAWPPNRTKDVANGSRIQTAHL